MRLPDKEKISKPVLRLYLLKMADDGDETIQKSLYLDYNIVTEFVYL